MSVKEVTNEGEAPAGRHIFYKHQETYRSYGAYYTKLIFNCY